MAENNQELQEAKELLMELNRLRAQLNKEPLQLTDEAAIKQLKSLPRDIEAARKELDNASYSASGLYNVLRGITSEFKGQKTGVLKVRGAFRQIEDAAQSLKLDEQGIVDLTRSQVEALQDKLVKSQAIADQEARTLIGSSDQGKELQRQVEDMKELGASADDINDYVNDYLKTFEDLTEEQKASIQNHYDQHDAIGQIIKASEKRLETEGKISDLMGVTGALVQGTGALMERLGMRSGIFHDAMQDATKEMRQMAKDTANGAANFSKLNIAAKGFGIVAKGFGKALFDPLTLVLKIVDGFLNVNKAAVDYTRLTGQNATATAGLNSRLATSVDFLETAAELTRQTGMAATGIFSPDTLGAIAEAKNLLGLTAEQAGNLGIRSKVAGVNIDQYKEGIVAATNEYNGANKSVVAHGVVLQDVLNTSDGIALSLGGNPKKIAGAAAAARSLGMELSKVDSIAGGLLDFESSIQNELEAQLLTGKNINLSKARELALNNDLEGLSKELAKNGASAAEFSKMNRIQQESLAKALGMSRDDLGKMAQQQLLAAGASVEQQAAARGVTVEQMEQMNIQDRIQKSLDKLSQAFAPILDALVPVVEAFVSILQPVAQVIAAIAGPLGTAIKFVLTPVKFLADILSKVANTGFGKVVIGITLVGVAISKLGGGVTGLGTMFSKMATGAKDAVKSLWTTISNPGDALKKAKDATKGIVDSFKSGWSQAGKVQSKAGDWYDKNSPQGKMIRTKGGTQSLTDKVEDKAKDVTTKVKDKAKDVTTKVKDKAKDVTEKVTDKTTEAAKGAADVPEAKSSGEKLKEFLTNLAAGLKEMASMEVVGGALALIPASLGLTAMIPGYLGAKLLETLNGEKLKVSLEGLANGLKAMANGTAVLGALALIPAGLGFAAFTVGSIGMAAIALGGTAASAGLTALSTGLSAMANPMAVLGALALIPAGLGFAAFTAGAIGMAAIALGGVATSAGLTALGVGLSAFGAAAMNPLTWAGVGLLAALGVALIPLTYALSQLAPLITAFGSVISSVLGGIAGIITAVAAGFTSFLGAITFEKIAALALLGPALMSVAGGLAVLSFSMFSALPAIGMLGALALMAGPLSTLATSLTAIAAGLVAITAALADLETEKIEELKGLISSTALAAPAVAASGAISGMINGITGGGDSKDSSNSELLAEIKLLRAAVEKGGDVYMDGNKVGMALTLATTRQ